MNIGFLIIEIGIHNSYIINRLCENMNTKNEEKKFSREKHFFSLFPKILNNLHPALVLLSINTVTN